MSFRLAGSLFGAALLAMGTATALLLPRWPAAGKVLPRERIVGAMLGVLCLIWSAHEAAPLLEESLAGYRRLLPYLVVVIGVLGILFLDYLFTRAVGGVLLLSIVWLLHQAFASHAPVRWLFAIVCYLLAIGGMFMIGSPWRFRDLLQRAAAEPRPRWIAAGCLLASGLVSLVVALGTRA